MVIMTVDHERLSRRVITSRFHNGLSRRFTCVLQHIIKRRFQDAPSGRYFRCRHDTISGYHFRTLYAPSGRYFRCRHDTTSGHCFRTLFWVPSRHYFRTLFQDAFLGAVTTLNQDTVSGRFFGCRHDASKNLKTLFQDALFFSGHHFRTIIGFLKNRQSVVEHILAVSIDGTS